ncbi:carbohydrate kinase family protein [Prochlorococcus marinus]|uniref:Putative carbohydrate kinase n=1 Tax=Prochlorococcus marinus (strain MIT 9211) TaxID=93059 RepID=A9BD71_PROM4|nr:carbohydrate kinase [Prochlorococcus marinus]ABX09684.1 Putative carbohydrate kinase [Prochlorococcus marinus str. MIT 9211]
MNSPKVICVGEALVDRLGPCGGDPAVDKPVQDCLGGAPANVACGLARLGIDAAFIGCLGDDSIGAEFRRLFMSRDVNIAGLQIHPELPSRVVLVRRDLSGERTFEGFEGDHRKGYADQHLGLTQLKETLPALFQEASWLLLGTILLASKSSKEAVLWMVDQAKKYSLSIAIDINWRPTFWDPNSSPDSPPSREIKLAIHDLLKHADLLKLAKEEAVWFFNSHTPTEISNSLPKKPSVIITDGSRPINWVLGESVGHMKTSVPRKVVDTTGAGDSFTAGIISQLLQTPLSQGDLLNPKEIVRFAAACGALVCEGAGAIEPQPIYGQVKEFLSLDVGEKS